MDIREATINDAKNITGIYRKAFDKAEAQIVSDFATTLLTEKSTVDIISLAVIDDEKVIGHIAFCPVFLESTNKHLGYILAPLAVSPDFQNKKTGSSLINHGLTSIASLHSSQSASQDAALVFVYGDPQYYSRFGFITENAENHKPPYELKFTEGSQVQGLNNKTLPASETITCVSALSNPDLW